MQKTVAEDAEAAVVQAEQAEKRGPGRPKHAKNRRSDALRQLQEERFGLTVGELLTETLFDGFGEHQASGEPVGKFMEKRAWTLAWRMGIPLAKAIDIVKSMADDLMPYVHQKLPTAIEVDQKGIMVAVIASDGGLASHAGVGAIDLRPAQARPDASKNDENDAKSDDDSRMDEE